MWVEARIALSLERKRPYCTGLNKYTSYVFQIICVSLPRYNNPSIECNEGSPNLMNIIVLKII